MQKENWSRRVLLSFETLSFFVLRIFKFQALPKSLLLRKILTRSEHARGC